MIITVHRERTGSCRRFFFRFFFLEAFHCSARVSASSRRDSTWRGCILLSRIKRPFQDWDVVARHTSTAAKKRVTANWIIYIFLINVNAPTCAVERCILHLVRIVGKISVLRFSVAAVALHRNHERKETHEAKRKGQWEPAFPRAPSPCTRVSACRIPACLAAEVERFTAFASLSSMLRLWRCVEAIYLAWGSIVSPATDRTEKPPGL